ncbi:MAG TPA: helix-turn-helix transcriptional regulator [Candidatus Limnocylindrales bacterium]
MDRGSGTVGYHRELVDRLAELRAGCGNPSYREIARRTPTSAGHVSDVLNGRKVPSGDMAASIAKALGADPNTQKHLRRYADRALADRVRPARGDTDNAVRPAVPVRSAYLEQVRRISPPRLVGRDDELRELERFCTAPDGGQYMWWRAAAWAGKSALMSWFVLHPPLRTRVVSFFITARFAGQSDRTAFADVLMEQLAQLLERPMPAFVTPATRDAHLLGMLGDAARVCQKRGQRLVLVVDGLDEDTGVVAGPDAYSIAAVLPSRPVAGMRVIVAGRPNPPVPADVPDDHPLRDPGIVRVLDESPHAKVIRTDAERELDRLLDGTPAEQDLLGLITAAGGGLSGADLAELTGWSPRQVDRQLHTVAGRTFARLGTGWRDGTGSDVYLLGHEELRISAIRFLGAARLDGYRGRLHTRADRYRDQGWPERTPEYLLRGYHSMLHDAGVLPQDGGLRDRPGPPSPPAGPDRLRHRRAHGDCRHHGCHMHPGDARPGVHGPAGCPPRSPDRTLRQHTHQIAGGMGRDRAANPR